MTTQEALKNTEDANYGGSAEGIRSHYDIGNAFWPKILGKTMAYSCALYRAPGEDLDVAQARKIDWHIAASAADKASSILDIGCGWGSVLRPLSERGVGSSIDGITLSDAQADYLAALDLPRVDVRVENWSSFEPARQYDSIISVGAFEHFAHSKQTRQQKIELYRDFFTRCRDWLSEDGRMSLQTIAYGNMRAQDASAFMNDEIFPDSELPYLNEITEALEGIFEVVAIRNDRLHYAQTMDAWGRNLASNKDLALSIVGGQKLADMERFFKLASVGFRMGKQNLLRFALRPIRSKWSTLGADHWDRPNLN